MVAMDYFVKYSSLGATQLWFSKPQLYYCHILPWQQSNHVFPFVYIRVSNTDPNLTITTIYHKKKKKEKGKKIKRDWPTKYRNIQNPRVSCIIFNDEKEVNANVCRTAKSLSRIVADIYCRTS